MMEQPWNQNFKHATGFGPEEEDFLHKNTIGFHLFDTQHAFFANVWLDFIRKDFILYWPPEDRSDEGLSRHRQRVKYALRWLFNALDPDVRNQELQLTPQVYPPGPSENRHSTILCSERPHPVFIIPDPTLEERAKAKAIHATKRAGGISISRNTWWSPHKAFLLYGYHRCHRHQSWSFPGPLGGTSLVKLDFVNLPVLPQKKTTIFSPDYDDLSPLPPHFLDTSSVNDTSHEQYHLDPEAYALAMAGDMENIATAPRRHIYSYNPLLTFSLYINDYLAESMRWEGRRDTISQKHCPSCRSTQINLRCITCRDVRLFCPACIVALHAACPTHIIQVRHIIGEVCPHPHPAFGDHFTIIDTNGIHDVALDFCNCIRERPLASQLQRAWLFPVTGREPRTAVTTAALEQFQMLTFMGKISTYEYYYSLVRLTDNTNTKTPSDNYGTFVRIVHEWSFIWQLKRAGIGNDPGGWKNAKPASCAVECLACPRPGINIPKVINPNEYMLSFSIKICILYTWAWMETSAWRAHVATTKPRRAIIERGIGLRISQLAGLEGLSAHDMSLSSLCPRLIYVLVKRESPLTVVTSYDIACQWSINLDKRIEIYGDHMRPQIPNSLYLVPKFHLPGHIEECQEKYCMSFHTKVGWAVSNGVAASTCEMGPGHRREKLDQHFGDYNWQKNIAQDAVPKASEHEDRFKRFTKSLPQQDVAKWTEIVEAWEADRTKLNPFTRTLTAMLDKTKAAMRLQLAQEDAQDELASLDGDEFHTMSPKDMISQGIQLEGSQRRIAWLNKDLGLHSTDLQRAQVLEKSNHLHRRIESWFIIQEVHMPMVRGLRIQDDKGNGPSLPAYSLPLYLPSSILSAHTCEKVLTWAEFRLRVAQGYDLLHTIHSQLLSLSKAYKDGDTNILMQKERLKCHKITRDLNTCITQAKQYYHDVRKRLLVLSEVLRERSWQAQLRILEDSDVRRISDDEMGISEGNRTMSWIWYSAHLGDVPGGVEECLRIEWCKTCARAHRWREECKLLSAEMGHVKQTLDYEADLWLSRASSTSMGGSLIQAGEGATAYAKRQASIRKSIRESFEKKWLYADQYIVLGETDESPLVDDDDVFEMRLSKHIQIPDSFGDKERNDIPVRASPSCASLDLDGVHKMALSHLSHRNNSP
ncbi:hypothetical protein EDD18DRAFT_1109505 [Armillaria luteobubalina]|uniref:CxC2-like cysteine cluster KDZ transposase-associated domain-containing protein n=1 Tax=Armillaria luteobubalina TaxID=153913 RepID=A0AA39TJG6_9AGAR|nr:hypothetical protein EDD18DRAFT_1109505 [Armillaria luteobubalina]